MTITSGEDARTQLPKNFKPLRKPSPSFQREGYFGPLVGGWRHWENKEDEECEGEKRMILTRNNPFDFDGDLKTNENEARGRMNELKTKNFENLTVCL